MRQIAIVNQSTVIPPSAAEAVVAALQIQAQRDFFPVWGILLNVALVPAGQQRGEVIYLLDDSDQADALGYHTEDAKGNPVGFAFAKTAQADGVAWPVTLSHELLEEAVDPLVNLLADAQWEGGAAGVAYEICDPVEEGVYLINNVPVSNFVTPWWFGGSFTPGQRFDFLGVLKSQLTMSAGGYVAFTRDLANWQDSFGQRHSRGHGHYTRHHRRHHRKLRP